MKSKTKGFLVQWKVRIQKEDSHNLPNSWAPESLVTLSGLSGTDKLSLLADMTTVSWWETLKKT